MKDVTDQEEPGQFHGQGSSSNRQGLTDTVYYLKTLYVNRDW